MPVNFQIGGSPLQARQTFPIGLFILWVLLASLFITLIFIIFKNINKYKKSDKYIQKEISRITTPKDLKKFSFEYHLPQKYHSMFLTMSKTMKMPNINYLIKDTQSLTKYFHDYYFVLKQKNATAEQINDFFDLNFTFEKISATTKNLQSTRQLILEAVVFYLTQESEQFPLYVKINNKDFLALEIPKFMYDNPNFRPPLLERLRFITKAENGMTYHFVSRGMRYQTNPDGKVYLIIAHSDDLLNQAHRNSKRESTEGECIFSPAHINHRIEQKPGEKPEYVINPKQYKGKLTNISVGGCCIKTNLPIREKQNLAVIPVCLDVNDHIIGIIRRTRKLPDNTYNLHIQFLDISLEAKNKINAYVFKYEL